MRDGDRSACWELSCAACMGPPRSLLVPNKAVDPKWTPDTGVVVTLWQRCFSPFEFHQLPFLSFLDPVSANLYSPSGMDVDAEG